MARSPALVAALRLLDLPASATEREVAEARRRLAKRLHPDVGGSEEQMQRLNDAVAIVLRSLAGQRPGPGRRPSPSPTEPAVPRRPTRPPGRPVPRRARTDHPSFTIDVLPGQAAVGLREAAASMGRIVDADSYPELDVVLSAPHCWCRLSLVPEGASTAVTLTVAPVGRLPPPDLDDVRDIWVAALNEIDWDRIAPPRPS